MEAQFTYKILLKFFLLGTNQY